MLRRFAGLAAGLVLIVSASSVGQAAPAPAPAKPAAPSPAASPAAAPVKTIVDYKGELSLKDEQIAKIKTTLGTFATDMQAKRQGLLTARQEYAKLIADHAALDSIKAKLQQIGGLELDIRWLDVTTSRNIEGILTPDQLAKWRDLQSKARTQKK